MPCTASTCMTMSNSDGSDLSADMTLAASSPHNDGIQEPAKETRNPVTPSRLARRRMACELGRVEATTPSSGLSRSECSSKNVATTPCCPHQSGECFGLGLYGLRMFSGLRKCFFASGFWNDHLRGESRMSVGEPHRATGLDNDCSNNCQTEPAATGGQVS